MELLTAMRLVLVCISTTPLLDISATTTATTTATNQTTLSTSNQSTTSIEMLELTSTPSVPMGCTIMATQWKTYFAGCPFYYHDMMDRIREDCEDQELECKLKCLDREVRDCDEHNAFASKLRNRLFGRLICAGTKNGIREEVQKYRASCHWNECLEESHLALISEMDPVRYCRHMIKVKECKFYNVTESCPQRIADYLRTEYITAFDICKPEDNPYYNAFHRAEYDCVGFAQRPQCEFSVIVVNVVFLLILNVFWTIN